MKNQTLAKWNKKPWKQTRYKGKLLLQTPVDLWLFEELIARLNPEVIVEAGVLEGGFSHWLSDRMQSYSRDRFIIGIDRVLPPKYNSLTTELGIVGLEGSSLDSKILDRVAELTLDKSKLVILDNDHSPSHVLKELDEWAKRLNSGDCLVVCDTIPVTGLEEAVAKWVASSPDFYSLPLDRFGLSNNRGGWLAKS